MKRRSFLKTLGAGVAATIVPLSLVKEQKQPLEHKVDNSSHAWAGFKRGAYPELNGIIISSAQAKAYQELGYKL